MAIKTKKTILLHIILEESQKMLLKDKNKIHINAQSIIPYLQMSKPNNIRDMSYRDSYKHVKLSSKMIIVNSIFIDR